jgi:anti-sigma regulatory factor (Ser/Thr protein kinase)
MYARFKGMHWLRFYLMTEFFPAFQRLQRWMRDLDFPRVDRFAMCLVLQEALTNAVRHGHGGDRMKPIRVTLMANPDEVVMEVEDLGQGFDTEAAVGSFVQTDRRPGRGLYLMQAYSSWMSINGRGNCITFGRFRTVRQTPIVVAPTASTAD